MKVPELMAILEKLDGVKISEPEFGDDDEESEEPSRVEPELEQTHSLDIQEHKKDIIQPVPEKIKKIKKVAVKKVIEPPVVLEKPKDKNYRKDINELIKQFEEDLYDLLKHFDDGELTQNDVDMITSEFDQMYDEVSNSIEYLLDANDVNDNNYLALIQRKLNSNTIKVQRFLETE